MNRANVPVVDGQQYRGETRGLLADFPLHDHGRMPFPYTSSLCVSVAFSSKVFYLPLHQPVSPGWVVHQTQAGCGMTHLGGGTHTVSECALLHVYKQTRCVCVCVCSSLLQDPKIGEKTLELFSRTLLRRTLSHICSSSPGMLSNCGEIFTLQSAKKITYSL